MHAMAALPWLRRALRLRPQRDQFGQRRHDALVHGIGPGRGRGRASGPHGTGTLSSSAATRRSPSQPSARAS